MGVPILLLVLGVGQECDPDHPTRCAAPVAKGQAAPFDGQLLSTELAIALGQKADGCDARTQSEVAYARSLGGVDLGLEKQLHVIDNEAARQREKLLEQQVADARPPWWERPFAVALLTAGVLSGVAWGMGQIVR